jgi:hypothetical protein
MAIDIQTQDIIIDETTGFTDNDVDPSVSPHDTNTTLQYLLSLDDPSGGLTSPEVAFQEDFVTATSSDAGETISSIVLAQDDNGTPFSTTDGVNSGIKTVDGNYVWLFQDPNHANVVIGVIGTSDQTVEPAETGPLAFSFALLSNGDSADLYTVQYVPLFHPDPSEPDDPDRIDLSNVVFASVTGTTSVSFTGKNAHPGSNEFNLLSSPDDASKQLLVTGLVREDQTDPNSVLVNSECNVSQQGFGVDNQSIQPDTDGQNQPLGREVLQVDFVTGGTDGAGDGADIAYGSHLDNITQAGFIINQLTPSTPTGRTDITISAFDVTGDEQGSEFFDGSPAVAAPITSVTLTGQSGVTSPITQDGTYDVAGNVNVTVSGLGTGVVTITGLDNVTTVDITTSSQMDRLHIECVDSDTGLDITEVHFSGESTNVASADVGAFINFDDDGPTITVPAVALELDNTAPPVTNTADFGYDIGSDDRTTAFPSDFVDSDDSLNGIQLALTGTVGQTDIINTDVTLQTETADSAVFDFTFDYDTDPITDGVQSATATGTLSFDKANDEYTVALDAPIEGFSIEVLQTSGLVAKNPTGNTGHPNIVVEQLTQDDDPNPFFVQFTADTTPLSFSFTGDGPPANPLDTTFNMNAGTPPINHDLAGGVETWVSATQSTNGVAGDTIQKNELLTLRFFGEDILSDANPGGTEKTDPTTSVSGLVVKFDGIGKSEDLIVILDLKDDMGTATTADDVEITRAVIVENVDIHRKSTGGVPSPYDAKFSLDNNDGLLIIESNDYNTGTEHYEIQGVQIMQSANGLIGTGINLNGAVGADGASTGTQSFSSGHTNDVLKITDIGFVRLETGTQDATLDFSFQIVDGDGDTTATQQLHVDVLNA